MTTENKRDLAVDLAICEAAETGVHHAEVCEWPGNDNLRHWVINVNDGIGCFIRYEDALFDAEAREGWPEAIRRAIAAEAEVARLEEFLRSESELAIGVIERMEAAEKENAILIEALRGMVSAVEHGALVKQKMSAALDYDIRRAKEALQRVAE